MGYSTKHINLETLLYKPVKEIISWSSAVQLRNGGSRQYELRKVLNLLKYVSGKNKSNISEYSLEQSDHAEPRYYLKHGQEFIEFTLKQEQDEPIKLHTATIDSKNIAYSSETEFLVQVGKGSSSYTTKYSFKGDLAKAIFHYKCINIGNGYKKRLYVPSFNKPLLARQFS